jgi:hypothetical protein
MAVFKVGQQKASNTNPVKQAPAPDPGKNIVNSRDNGARLGPDAVKPYDPAIAWPPADQPTADGPAHKPMKFGK